MRTMPRAATATIGAAPPVNLPPGTRLRSLTAHGDRRGWLVEAFRAEWEPDVAGAQVNVSSSAPGVLRGSHVHGRHTDYFVLASGAATVGDRKSTRLNSSHVKISYAVFCLKKKTQT